MYDHWLSLLKEEDQYGRKDYNRADAYLDSLTDQQRAFIDKKGEAGLERLDPVAKQAMQDLRSARETLKPYRDVLNKKLAAMGVLDRWLTANPAERDRIEKEPRFKTAERLASAQKESLRRRNPAVDRALVDWYGLVSIRGRR